MPPVAVLGIVAIVLALVAFAWWVEGLALFAPRSTKRIASSAQQFCVHECRTSEGECPLARHGTPPEECPLWRFVNADMPTSVYGSPFAHLRAS